MSLKTIEMDELLAILDKEWPTLEWEVDRNWIWLTSDLAPVHKGKCECLECKLRANYRKAMGRGLDAEHPGLGFIFAKNGHTLPSGDVSYWGNHCTKPTRFKRRSKKAGQSSDPRSETSSATRRCSQ